MSKKISDFIQLSKLSKLIKKEEEERKKNKVLKIVIICASALVFVAGIGFLLYRLLGRPVDDYDLYDDLDNYYDEADHYEIDHEAGEADFAE